MGVSGQPLSMAQTQELSLGVLDCLDSYCTKHNLTYFLLGGSLIGAVRDHDLVPWDDDIDVAMPREDYERLIDEFEDTENYRLIHMRRTEGCVYGMAKLVDRRTRYVEKYIDEQPYMGVFIDIFPLDKMPEGDATFIRKCRFLVDLYRFGFALSEKASIGKPAKEAARRVLHVALAPFGRVRFFNHVEKAFQSKSGGWLFNGWGAWGERECGPADWFKNSVPVIIRGKRYPAPAGYDAWLTKVYGDYRTPPENPPYSHGEFYLRAKESSAVVTE